MFDPQKLLEQVLGGARSPDGKPQAGLSPDLIKGLAAGGVAGGLAGILLGGKTSKKLAKGAVKLGGTAALAGLAYKAYTQWQASRNAGAAGEVPPMKDITPAAEGTPFLPAPAPQREAMSLAILRAMIAAAKADGAIDAEERGRIAAQLDGAGLSPAARDKVLADFDKPLAPAALAKLASDPMLAAQLYAAAVVGAGEVAAAERAWLDEFAKALKLDRAATAAIEARLS